MSGVSQKAEPDEVLPLLAHFIEIYGYEGAKEKSARPTEALTLFKRYFAQANALASFAGTKATLHFSTCEESRPLLTILGYRLKEGCGHDPSIEVANAEKAFITVDSGFPLADMEQDLHDGRLFSMPYPSVRVPLIYEKDDWTGNANSTDADLIASLTDHPLLSRLYWALSCVDEETREQLLKILGMKTLLGAASVLDFYGSNLAIRNGHVAVPGGTQAETSWKSLVGADPSKPGEFLDRLLQRDNGSLAEYFDSIARAPFAQQTYLTSRERLGRYYRAFHGNNSSDDAVHSVLRPGAALLLLVTRLPLGDGGQPLVPGNLSVWQEAFHRKPVVKTERSLVMAGSWTSPDQLVQALFAASRFEASGGPFEMYMTLSEIERGRSAEHRMSPETARLLITHYSTLHDQYQIFCEFPGLDDASILQFVKTTETIDRIHDPLLRGDTKGLFEANVGLWQIFARQGQISSTDLSNSWRRVISPFAVVSNSAQVFDAARTSLEELTKTVSGDGSDITQEGIINLLAGPKQSNSDGRQVHDRLAAQIRQVLSDQRLVSLDTLFEFRQRLANVAQNSSGVDPKRTAELAEELEEARSPRAMFTDAERAEWAPERARNQHVVVEMRTDWKKLVSGSARGGETAGGALTPFLRDTLVGLNYAYYEPPSAQILHSSPLLVRAHDFLASDSTDEHAAWRAPRLLAVGQTAAKGAHLSGSLAGLPYALAEIEQDFIVPENVQALIWHETSADLLVSSTVPRWWSTSHEALHAAGLYQKTGEELIAASAKDENLRIAVTGILSHRLLPKTLSEVSQSLYEGHPADALGRIAPADLFYLAAQSERLFPGRMSTWSAAGGELEVLRQRNPELDSERLAHEFGVPHPVLSESYYCEMLNTKPFPSLMSYASELLAESWESTNLYWARLADDMGYPPVMLNELAPMLTRRMVGKIFASDFDDWAALIRAMRETGEEFRHTRLAGKSDSDPSHVPVPAN